MDIAGATAASLTMPAAISPDCGASFTVVVANSAGSVTSTRATLTVTPAPGAPVILKNPERARVLADQKASFSVTARSASPMSYQWQKGTHAGNMMDIAGATEATYATPPATLTDHGMLFRCVVSNRSGNATSASELLAVTTGARAQDADGVPSALFVHFKTKGPSPALYFQPPNFQPPRQNDIGLHLAVHGELHGSDILASRKASYGGRRRADGVRRVFPGPEKTHSPPANASNGRRAPAGPASR